MNVAEGKVGAQNPTDAPGKSFGAQPGKQPPGELTGRVERTRRLPVIALALVAIVFGLLSLKEGGSVLFVDGASRAQAGNYVPFVVWFNFLAGFAYVVAGIGLWLRRRWAVGLSIAIAIATLAAFAALGVHVAVGGAFEPRTVVAMVLRSVVWVVIAVLARRFMRSASIPRNR